MSPVGWTRQRVAGTLLLCSALAVSGVLLIGVVTSSRSAPHPDHLIERMVRVDLIVSTLLVPLVIGLLATVLAIPAAWSMRRLAGFWPVLMLAPMLLPNYLVYYSWSRLRGPGTWMGEIILRADDPPIRLIQTVQAVGSLALWSWPIAAMIVATRAKRIDRETLDALRLSPASAIRKCLLMFGLMRGALVLAALTIALIMLGSAVPLHLAEVGTYSLVIWQLMNESPMSVWIWLAAAPVVAVVIMGGWVLWRGIIRATIDLAEPGVDRDTSVHPGWLIPAILIWLVSVVLPLVLFCTGVGQWQGLGRTLASMGDAVAVSAAAALVVGVVISVLAGGSITALRGRRAGAAGQWAVLCWLTLGLVPGVLVGQAILAAMQTSAMSWLDGSTGGHALAHVARFGIVGVLTGWWVACTEPSSLRDLRELCAGGSVGSWWQSTGSLYAGPILGAGLIGLLLSMHEIEAANLAATPGKTNLAGFLLGKLHYLRDDELSFASIALLGGGLLVGCVALLLLGSWTRKSNAFAATRRLGVLVVLGVIALRLGGCDRPSADANELPTQFVFGSRGVGDGQFVYPRAIDSDGEHIWIIDKTARVQRFDRSGGFLGGWTMPAYDNGMPVGICSGPDNVLYIADTHEHRVAVFDKASQDGIPIRTWGTYGVGPGEFIYPTDVAVAPAGAAGSGNRVYVSEYGGNDRISVFDEWGNFLFAFGREGSSESADDICFKRPQALLYHADLDELIVADAVNHRLGRFTRDGRLIRWLGRPDAQTGQSPVTFRYPYGLALLPEGDLLVSEFGNDRLQRIDPESGQRIAMYGRSGRAEGELLYPWGVACIGDRVFVLDSGNNRVQVFAITRSWLSPW